MSKHYSPSRHDVDDELREILGDDADQLVADRQHLRRQLDANAFAQRSVRADRRAWYERPFVWFAGAGGAVAAVLLVITLSGGTVTQQQTEAQAVLQVQSERTDIDVLITETLASVDDVWEQGEVDIDRLISERSTK